MTNTLNEISVLVKSFTDQRKVLVERLKTEFHGLFTEVFEQVPEVKSFVWTQYSPYFNDGEPCTFSRHEIEPLMSEDGEYDGGYSDDAFPDAQTTVAYMTYLETEKFPLDFIPSFTEEYCQKSYEKSREEYILSNSYWIPQTLRDMAYNDLKALAEKSKYVKATIDALETIPEDMYEDLFGDGVKVKVTRSGVEVDEYDHE